MRCEIDRARFTNKAVLHCLRAPVGGLFRHVVDLANAQVNLGHRVGVVCAASGDALTEARLLALAPKLTLGLHRLPMSRDLGLGDFKAWQQVVSIANDLGVDVLHGHGAKGGAYARLAARSAKKQNQALRCFYTPHGGSLHYAPTTMAGLFYGALERRLETWTDGILFESQFAARRYAGQIGAANCATRVVTNGLLASEFTLVECADTAADFVFVGELRLLKGVDVALKALAVVNRKRRATAVIAGGGPDAEQFKMLAQTLGLGELVTFPGVLAARAGFAMGRVLLVPSRAESLPYIVLEAVAAGLPLLATDVGGIPEIVTAPFGSLLPAGDVAALACAMEDALERPDAMRTGALGLRDAIRDRFTVQRMATAITDFYSGPHELQRAA